MIRASQVPIKSGSDIPTDEELYAWTMRGEAVAPCLIEDIFHLRQSPAKSESPGLVLVISCDKPSLGHDFNWLGRVPCRSVRIAGMVVGIKDYESKRIYTSAIVLSFTLSIMIYIRTVDDNSGIVECHHKDLVTPFSPSKRRDRKFQGFNYPPLPPPVTYVGRPVIVAGRVCRGRKIYLIVESIGWYRPCPRCLFSVATNLMVAIASTVQVL